MSFDYQEADCIFAASLQSLGDETTTAIDDIMNTSWPEKTRFYYLHRNQRWQGTIRKCRWLDGKTLMCLKLPGDEQLFSSMKSLCSSQPTIKNECPNMVEATRTRFESLKTRIIQDSAVQVWFYGSSADLCITFKRGFPIADAQLVSESIE